MRRDLFIVRVPPEVGKQIREEAKRLDVSYSSFIGNLVAKALHSSPATGVIKKCAMCKKKFICFRGKGPKQLYCSRACKQRAYRLRKTGGNNEPKS